MGKRIIFLADECIYLVYQDMVWLLPTDCPYISLVRKHLAAEGLNTKEKDRTIYIKFVRDAPNNLWQIDIAGGQTVGQLGKLYLPTAIDDCSRFVVAARHARTRKA